jgi:hypothetical protein
MPTKPGNYDQIRELTAARTGNPADARLRKFGFQIAERPAKGPNRWRRNSRIYDEIEADLLASILDEKEKRKQQEEVKELS